MWVFLILLVPVFGGLFYLLFTFQSSTKRFQKRIMHAEEKSKDLWSLPETGYAEALTKAPEHAQPIRSGFLTALCTADVKEIYELKRQSQTAEIRYSRRVSCPEG